MFGYPDRVTSLQDVTEFEPDLLILGYIRAYTNGEMAMVDTLRAHPLRRTLSVLLCATGYDLIHHNAPYIPDPFTRILVKPFSAGRFYAEVEGALRLSGGAAICACFPL